MGREPTVAFGWKADIRHAFDNDLWSGEETPRQRRQIDLRHEDPGRE